MKAVYFKTPPEFGKCLWRNHATVREILVGFYKKDSEKPSMTWPESVDEALCVYAYEQQHEGLSNPYAALGVAFRSALV